MNKKFSALIAIFVLTIFPSIVLAQLDGIAGLIDEARTLVSRSFALLVGIALLVFFWGIIKFILAQGSETAKAEGKKIMGWGLVALFVMVSVWGLVRFLQSELLPGGNFDPPPVPTL